MPAPKRFPNRDEVAAVRAEAEPLENGASADTSRRLAGRVMARRDMGKLVFLDLVDRSGRIQLLCPVERTGEVDVHLGTSRSNSRGLPSAYPVARLDENPGDQGRARQPTSGPTCPGARPATLSAE